MSAPQSNTPAERRAVLTFRDRRTPDKNIELASLVDTISYDGDLFRYCGTSDGAAFYRQTD